MGRDRRWNLKDRHRSGCDWRQCRWHWGRSYQDRGRHTSCWRRPGRGYTRNWPDIRAGSWAVSRRDRAGRSKRKPRWLPASGCKVRKDLDHTDPGLQQQARRLKRRNLDSFVADVIFVERNSDFWKQKAVQEETSLLIKFGRIQSY